MQRIFVALLLVLVTLGGCKKAKRNYQPYRILILGNSITHSDPYPPVGWNGNWGMAATSADKDYVHLLSARLKLLNPGNEILAKNIASFESKFDSYSIPDSLNACREYNPDILVLRIGENVLRVSDEALFEKRYGDLINYFKAKNAKLLVLGAGSVWPSREMANRVMAKFPPFTPLEYLYYDTSNYSFGLFADAGLQSHPSDKGMKEISDNMYYAITRILYPDIY